MGGKSEQERIAERERGLRCQEGKWIMKRAICGPLEILTHMHFVIW